MESAEQMKLLVNEFVERICDHEGVSKASAVFAANFRTASLDEDEDDAYWLAYSTFQVALAMRAAIRLGQFDIFGREPTRGVEFFNPPQMQPIRGVGTEEQEIKLRNTVADMSEEQLRITVLTMLGDPCNKIDLDNFSHYFC